MEGGSPAARTETADPRRLGFMVGDATRADTSARGARSDWDIVIACRNVDNDCDDVATRFCAFGDGEA